MSTNEYRKNWQTVKWAQMDTVLPYGESYMTQGTWKELITKSPVVGATYPVGTWWGAFATWPNNHPSFNMPTEEQELIRHDMFGVWIKGNCVEWTKILKHKNSLGIMFLGLIQPQKVNPLLGWITNHIKNQQYPTYTTSIGYTDTTDTTDTMYISGGMKPLTATDVKINYLGITS